MLLIHFSLMLYYVYLVNFEYIDDEAKDSFVSSATSDE